MSYSCISWMFPRQKSQGDPLDMDIEETAQKIENMEIRGAAKIARAVADALKNFALDYDGTDLKIQRRA